MKISETELSRLLALSSASRHTSRQSAYTSSASATYSKSGSSAAQVDVSASAQEIQRVKQLVNQVPDTRQARVAELKTQVENGTYHVSSEDIADLMIRRVLADNTYF